MSMPDEISPEFRLKIPHPCSEYGSNRNSLARFVYRRRLFRVEPGGHAFFLDLTLPSDGAESCVAVRRRALDAAESDGNTGASDDGASCSDRGSSPARRRSLSR